MVAIVTSSAIGLLIAPRAPDPTFAIEARRLVTERADAATHALDELRAALSPALDEARAASAAIVSATADPTPAIERAADAVAAVQPAAARARETIAGLNAAAGAWAPDEETVSAPFAPGELSSIADQLRAAEDEAAAFVELRLRATDLPAELDAAVTALQDGDADAARERLDRAAATVALAAEWDAAPVTMPVWLETARAMIAAVTELAAAVRDGDADRAASAAADIDELDEGAEDADRALQIALAEGGAGIIGVPLGRLADVTRRTEASRTAAATLAGAPAS